MHPRCVFLRRVLLPELEKGVRAEVVIRGASSGLTLTLPPGDEELVREVLFDAVVTAPMEAYWTALALNISE